MKKTKEIFSKNTKVIIAFIVGIIISGTTVYAATTLLSQSVYYNNSTSGATSTNVQGALDELYTRANTWINPNNNMGTPQYYAFGQYKGWCTSTGTNCSSLPDFPTTSTTPPSGKNVYAAKYEDGGYGVCINRNGTQHCFRGRNWAYELQHVQKVFSDVSCIVSSSTVHCFASDFGCRVYSNGYVYCVDYGADARCDVYSDGRVRCSE